MCEESEQLQKEEPDEKKGSASRCRYTNEEGRRMRKVFLIGLMISAILIAAGLAVCHLNFQNKTEDDVLIKQEDVLTETEDNRREYI